MKKAVVTGTSGNLGPLWVEALQEMGFDVWGIDLPNVDVSNREQVMVHARLCKEMFGIPDVIICNAGKDNPPGSGTKFFTDYERIIEVNLFGTKNISEAFLPYMQENGGGVIIAVGSIMGKMAANYNYYEDGFEKPSGYNSSKAGINHFMECLAVQYGQFNVRAGVAAFGPVDTGKFDPVFKEKILKRIPLGRLVSPRSVKNSLWPFLNIPELTGQVLLVDGGMTLWL